MFESRASFIGFVLGAGVPVTYGFLLLRAHHAYVDSLLPGEAACGMPALGGFGLILVVGPIGGVLGLIAGAVASWLWKAACEALTAGIASD